MHLIGLVNIKELIEHIREDKNITWTIIQNVTEEFGLRNAYYQLVNDDYIENLT